MRTTRTARAAAAAGVSLALALAAAPATAADPTGISIVGLTDSGTSLVTFSSAKPQQTTAPVLIAGLAAGETVVGIDRRPRTGELFAVTSASRLLVVDAATGAATQRAVLSVALVGERFGVDFNPTVDRLRIVSDADQNLRVVPDTGATTVDGALNYAAGDAAAGTNPTVAGAAYTNNDSDFIATPTNPAPTTATGTQLFDIDATLGTVVLQNPPNAGALVTVGALGQNGYESVGFDNYSEVEGGKAISNITYAVLGKGGTQKLYTVDRSTGAATLVGPFGSQGISDLAVPIDN